MATTDVDTFDIFLVLSSFRDSVPELKALLRPFGSLEQQMTVAIEGYYSPRLDSALVALRFNRRAAAVYGFEALKQWVFRLGFPIITPEELPFDRRCAFYIDHLSFYTTYVQYHSTADDKRPLLSALVGNLAQHILVPVERARTVA